MRGSTQKLFMAIWCTLLLISVSRTGLAASEAETATPKDLIELAPEELMKVEVATVYSASKFEQKVTEAPSSVSIVTADEIRKYGYRTLADILRSQKGFYISYDRNYSYVGVRGFGRGGSYNSRIQLLVDGHRINDNLFDSALIGTEFVLDIDLIDRVEVIRGPGSSLYGNSAFFAVVNVITRGGEGQQGAELSGEAGSFDTYKGRLTYAKSFRNGLEALVSGSLSDSNGDSLFFKEFNTPANNNGLTSGTDFDRSYNTLTKLTYRDFTLEGLYSSRTKGVPTAAFGTNFNDRRHRTTDELWFLELKYEHSFGESANAMGRLFYDSYDFTGDYPFGGGGQRNLAHGRWWGGELQASVSLLDRHKLVIGTEYRDNLRQDQKNIYVGVSEPPIFDDKRSSQVWAVYLQDQFTLFKNLILNAGVRYDHYSTFGSTVNPRIGLIYTPIEGTVFKILYGSAFRSPNVFELYYQDSVSQTANPGLKPEKIKTYEIIYEQYIGSNIRASLSGFYYTINDLIVAAADPANSTKTKYMNLNNVEADGVEAELEGKWGNGWAGRVSYSFQDAWNSDTGVTLADSPQHLAKVNLTIPLVRDKIFFGLEEQYTSKRKTLVNGNFAKSFFVTNLTLHSRELLKGLELSVSLYNLFDYRYGDPGGPEHIQDTVSSRFSDPAHPLDIIQQDGRTFRVKLTYRF